MTKRYTVEADQYGFARLVYDSRNGFLAGAASEADATRIVDALNAVDQLTKAVWGTEGCPAWLEAQR